MVREDSRLLRHGERVRDGRKGREDKEFELTSDSVAMEVLGRSVLLLRELYSTAREHRIEISDI